MEELTSIRIFLLNLVPLLVPYSNYTLLKNIRETASIAQLLILANLETINAELIKRNILCFQETVHIQIH